ncbi:MAG TPA: alpha/beta hydrolase [Vicinamibacteria bacterium]|nr:alpha/beta hydrolase [Vicinamibacteria bacterium]
MATIHKPRLANGTPRGRSPLGGIALALLMFGLASLEAEAGERFVALSPLERLRVTEAGSGPPVVLIPGLFGCAFGYRGLLSELALAGYHGVVVEPLGVGGSSRPEGLDYSLTAQADRVGAVLKALELPPAVVVAHAVGASIAFRLAWRHPERVAAIVSIDGGPAEAATTPGFRRAMRWAPLLKIFGGVGRIRGRVRTTLVERSADPRWVSEAVLDGYMEPLARDLDATLGAFQAMARSHEPEPLRDRLPDVRCPVLLLVGAFPHEGGASAEEIDLLRTRLPRFALESVPGTGHFVFEEAPRAVVAAVQRTFTGDSRAVAAAMER